MTAWTRIKFRLAQLIDSDEYCWAALVSWALQYDYPFQAGVYRTKRRHHDRLRDCKAGACKNERPCYCGKFGIPEAEKPASFFED